MTEIKLFGEELNAPMKIFYQQNYITLSFPKDFILRLHFPLERFTVSQVPIESSKVYIRVRVMGLLRLMRSVFSDALGFHYISRAHKEN